MCFIYTEIASLSLFTVCLPLSSLSLKSFKWCSISLVVFLNLELSSSSSLTQAHFNVSQDMWWQQLTPVNVRKRCNPVFGISSIRRLLTMCRFPLSMISIPLSNSITLLLLRVSVMETWLVWSVRCIWGSRRILVAKRNCSALLLTVHICVQIAG